MSKAFPHLPSLSGALLCACTVLLNAATVQAADLKVFLLGGQSNMDGRAPASGLPPLLQSPQTDVLFYEGGSLRDLQPDSGTDFGPEITFGRTMADAFSSDSFALIKYGIGGADLNNDWDPTSGSAYNTFNTTVTNGLNALAGMGHTTEIAGMLWTQGERDAVTGRSTAQYEFDLNEFIGDVRTRYGTDLPFLVSQLSSAQTALDATGLNSIRVAQANVAASDPNTLLIDTDSFGMKTDNLHFSAAGQQALGTAFANQAGAVLQPTGGNIARFDFGNDADDLLQAGWNPFEVPFAGDSGPQTTPADSGTGWSVTLNPSVTASETEVLSRNRNPLDATTGGTFNLENVYIDYGVAIESLSVMGLNPSETYDIQFIMYDDNAANDRTQDVFNVTGGANDFLGTSNGPGGAGTGGGVANLSSNDDFSVFGTGLSPNSSGELDFVLANSATGDRSLVNGVVITDGNGSQTSLFDLGVSDDNNEYQQSGWTQFEFPMTANNSETSPVDPATGWSVEVSGSVDETPGTLLGRSRDPLDGTTGGSFSLDEVFADFITGVDSLEVNGLDPTKSYNVQLIMYDDDGEAGRTQTVTNITDGASNELGTTSGPGSPAATLASDTEFSILGMGLVPDSSGKLIFAFENSATIDRSLVNGLVITEVSADFDGNGDVDGIDFLTWQRGFGLTSQADNMNGDANGDGNVDGGDLSVWRGQYGTSAAAQSAVAAVPEPSSLGLVVACGIACVRMRYRGNCLAIG